MFDRKVFVAVFYLGEAEAQQDLFHGRVLERLRGDRPPALAAAPRARQLRRRRRARSTAWPTPSCSTARPARGCCARWW